MPTRPVTNIEGMCHGCNKDMKEGEPFIEVRYYSDDITPLFRYGIDEQRGTWTSLSVHCMDCANRDGTPGVSDSNLDAVHGTSS